MTNDLSNLRVLIVDDDPAYRRIVGLSLRRIGVQRSDVAPNLSIARGKLERESFDAVTIDVVLDGESGLDLLPWLHRDHKKVASILLTAGSESYANKAVDALLLGASTLIVKPGGSDPNRELDMALSRVLASVAREKRAAMLGSSAAVQTPPGGTKWLDPQPRELIAIGASTGGPPALVDLLSVLPDDYVSPVLITQHMPAFHMPHFAEVLQKRLKRPVVIPANGEVVRLGRIYVAPGGCHMILKRSAEGLMLMHDDGPEEHNCKPAVDPLFRSVATVCGHLAVGVVMTGMGDDGAAGAVAMHAAGAPILVQDRDSSVVWGMPGAVVAKGVADIVAQPVALAKWVMSLDSSYKNRERTAL